MMSFKNPFTNRFWSRLALLVPLSWCLFSSNWAAAQSIHVTLKPVALAANSIITVGDVATVSVAGILDGQDARGSKPATSTTLLKRLESLDLKTFTGRTREIDISTQQLTARILLSGVKSSELTVDGAESATVYRADVLVFRRLLHQAIVGFLAAEFQVAEDDVLANIDLDGSLFRDIVRQWTADSEFRPLSDASELLGRGEIQIGIYVAGTYTRTIATHADISLYRMAPVATRPISVGEQLDASNTGTARVRFDSATAIASYIRDVDGLVASRPLHAQQTITANDVRHEIESEQTPSSIVVKARDNVTVVARSGSLQVTLSGAEALQSGRVGDVIQVRNTASGKTLFARIKGNGLLEASF